MSEEIIRVLPGYYVILSFTTGFFIVLLSPLHLLLPSVFNPFLQEIPSEALSAMALFAITSLIMGIPGVLFRDLIVAKRGVNERFFDFLRKDFIIFVLTTNMIFQNNIRIIKKNFMITEIAILVNKPFMYMKKRYCLKYKKKSFVDGKESFSNANYAMWVTKSGIGGYLSILNLKEGVTSGIIIGTELAFLFDIVALSIFPSFRLSTQGILTLAIYSFTIFFLICLVNKIWFRGSMTDAIKDVNKQYENRSKPNYESNTD